jgi:PKD repeat protein
MKGRKIVVFGFILMMLIVSISSIGGSVGPQEKGFSDSEFHNKEAESSWRTLLNVDDYEIAKEDWLAFLERQRLENENKEIIDNLEMEERIEDEFENPNPGDSWSEQRIEEEFENNQMKKTVFVGSNDYRYPSTFSYITADAGEELVFDLSQMFRMCNLKEIESYEFDFDGDGTYEFESTSPTYEHTYEEYGVYCFKFRISGFYLKYDHSICFFTVPYDIDIAYIKLLASYEYEIKVSVGSRDTGYPAIPDFSVSGFEYSNLYTYKQKVYDDNNYYCINITNLRLSTLDFPTLVFVAENDSTQSVGQACSVVPVRIYEDQEEQKFLDPTVECDASSTIKPDECETDYYWDFGDGTNKKGKSVRHAYKRGGEYEITLKVNNKAVWKSKTVNILRGMLDPKITIITNDNYLVSTYRYIKCPVNEQVTFDLTIYRAPNPNILYDWDLDGDGKFEYSSSSPRMTHEFSEIGVHEIRFRISDINPQVYTKNYDYIIYCLVGSQKTGYPPLPEINIRSRADLMVPQNQEEQFTPQVTIQEAGIPDNDDFVLEFGDIAEGSEIVNVPSDTVEFNIQVRNTANSQDIIDISQGLPIQITNWWPTIPTIRWHWEVDEEVLTKLKDNCNFVEPQRIYGNIPRQYLLSVRLIASDTITVCNSEWEYFWDFGDGNQSSGNTTTHVYQNPGFYDITLWVHNEYFNISKTTTIRVNRLVQSRIPFIYLYPEQPTYDEITVRFQGYAVLTVPEVEMGTEIKWEGIWVDGGSITYNGQTYDYLIYECDIVPVSSRFGWILERDESGQLYLDGTPLTYEELRTFFRNELKKAGLYDNEIQDFLNECLGEDELFFFGQETFRYAIRYIAPETLDQVMNIETKVDYDNIIRIQFLLDSLEGDEVLTPPTYPEHGNTGGSLHEWGIIKGSNIP